MLRWASFAAGIVLVAIALAAWRVPAASGPLGAELRVSAVPAGELTVSRIDPFLVETGLRPTGRAPRAAHTLTLRNVAGRPLGFRMRSVPSGRGLDGVLRIEARVGGHELYTGTLGGLRRWTRGVFSLASGERSPLAVKAWLPSSAARGSEGMIEDVSLEFRASS